MQKNEILCSKRLVEELRAKLQVTAAEKDNAQTQLRAYVEAEAAVSTSFVLHAQSKPCTIIESAELIRRKEEEL